MPGINLISRYIYTENFAWWMVLIFAGLLAILAKAACVVTDYLFEKKIVKKKISLISI